MDGNYYSVGAELPGLGVPVGQYGGGNIALIDPVSAGWRNWTRLSVGSGHESVSAFQLIDNGAGMNAWTEADGGAQCWTAWAPDWRWGLTQTMRPWPWALAGPSAVKQGWIGLSEGRKGRMAGGWIAMWLVDRWGPITPTIPGVIVWDAVPWGEALVLGCSLGDGAYLQEVAGRLVLVDGQGWRFVNLPGMAGVLRLVRLESFPDRLWLCTTWGEIWWTDDLESFHLWHRGDYGFQRNVFLHEVEGGLLVTGARGYIWEYAQPEAGGSLVLEIPNVEFMALTPVGGALVGSLTERGAARSRPVVIHKEN